MRKARLLLLALPLVAGVFYMRELASWRPQKVFAERGQVSQLVFSSDGKMLLVTHSPTGSSLNSLFSATITTLDASRSFQPLWQRKNNLGIEGAPQFFANDSDILVHGWDIQILDAHTGKRRKGYGDFAGRSAMSPDGKWLAYNGANNRYGDMRDGRIFINPRPKVYQSNNNLLAVKTLGQQYSEAREFAFSPDSKTFVVGVGDRNGAHLDFYDTSTWKLARTWTDVKRRTSASLIPSFPFYQTVQWSRDGRLLLSGWYQMDGGSGFILRSASDGKRLASYSASSGSLTNASYISPYFELQNDGHVLYRFSTNRVLLSQVPQLYSPSRSTQLLQLPNEIITATTVSPDRSTLVVGTGSGRVYRKRLK